MNILFARHLKQGHTPPPTPTNEDRLREFRKAAPVVLANGTRWKWRRKHLSPARAQRAAAPLAAIPRLLARM